VGRSQHSGRSSRTRRHGYRHTSYFCQESQVSGLTFMGRNMVTESVKWTSYCVLWLTGWQSLDLNRLRLSERSCTLPRSCLQ